MGKDHFDVVVIGAGISGISAAYHLQKYCPDKSYTVLEGRSALGGTWDLFRFPGIRSDSEMYTLGFSFKPWTNKKSIADGQTILNYLYETVEEFGIDKHIRYDRKVIAASWSSNQGTWTLSVHDNNKDEITEISCNFVVACTGYYNYEEGYTPKFEGKETFKGLIVHPQHWNPDTDYQDKKVVVIGSGATAITLVPALATKAAHVIMLQRSPTFVLAETDEDGWAKILFRILPFKWAYKIVRWKNIILSQFFYKVSRRYPNFMKKLMIKGVKKELGKDFDVEKHFTPTYNPWDQRVCLASNGDFFESIRQGKASVVTDIIHRFTEKGVLLKSGEEIETDIIVTATGLNLKIMSNMKIVVDGEEIEFGDTIFYKNSMFSNVPNLTMTIGYTNASWSLKADLVSLFVCRLLNYMDKNGYKACVPTPKDPNMETDSAVEFTSGYFQRSIEKLPKQGDRDPWKVKQNYFKDIKTLKRQPLEDEEMIFIPKDSEKKKSRKESPVAKEIIGK